MLAAADGAGAGAVCVPASVVIAAAVARILADATGAVLAAAPAPPASEVCAFFSARLDLPGGDTGITTSTICRGLLEGVAEDAGEGIGMVL